MGEACRAGLSSGRGLIKVQPWPDRSELNEGKAVGGKPVVARRNPTDVHRLTVPAETVENDPDIAPN